MNSKPINLNPDKFTPEYIYESMNSLNTCLPIDIQKKLKNLLEKIAAYLSVQESQWFSNKNTMLQASMEEYSDALQRIMINSREILELNFLNSTLLPLFLKIQIVIKNLIENETLSHSCGDGFCSEISSLQRLINEIKGELQTSVKENQNTQQQSQSSEQLKGFEKIINDLSVKRLQLKNQIEEAEDENPSQYSNNISEKSRIQVDQQKQKEETIQQDIPKQPIKLKTSNIFLYDYNTKSSELEKINKILNPQQFTSHDINSSMLFNSRLTVQDCLTKIFSVMTSFKTKDRPFRVILMVQIKDDSKFQQLEDGVFKFVTQIKKENLEVELNFIEIIENNFMLKRLVSAISDSDLKYIRANSFTKIEQEKVLYNKQSKDPSLAQASKNAALQEMNGIKERYEANYNKAEIKNSQAQKESLENQKNFQYLQEFKQQKKIKLENLRRQMQQLDQEIIFQSKNKDQLELVLQNQNKELKLKQEKQAQLGQVEKQENSRILDLILERLSKIDLKDTSKSQKSNDLMINDLKILQSEILQLQVKMFPDNNGVLFAKYILAAQIVPLDCKESIYGLVCKNILQKSISSDDEEKLSNLPLQILLQEDAREQIQTTFMKEEKFLALLTKIYDCFSSLGIMNFFKKEILVLKEKRLNILIAELQNQQLRFQNKWLSSNI